MVRRTGMLVLAITMLFSAGCSRTQIVRMSRLEQANVVKLEDQGDPRKEGDESVFVLDEPPLVEKVTVFLKNHTENWRPTGDLPRPARYTLSFRKNGETTDVFWLNQGRIETKDPAGATYCITLSDDDVEELINLFHGMRDVKSS